MQDGENKGKVTKSTKSKVRETYGEPNEEIQPHQTERAKVSDAFSAQKDEGENDSHTPSLFTKTFTASPLKEQNLNLRKRCKEVEIKRTYDLIS